MGEDLKHIIESILFVADEPLSIERIKTITDTPEAAEVRSALSILSEEYESRGGGFYLVQVAGGYRLRTRPEFREWITRLVRPHPPRLSRAALETLAVIAYKQPVIRADIEHIRGVDCGGVLRLLLKRKLVRILGRKEIPGRPLIYATTKQFLEIFDLKDLKDLPTQKEIEAFGSDEPEELEYTDDREEWAGDEPDASETEPVDTDASRAGEDVIGADPEGESVTGTDDDDPGKNA